MSISLRQFKSSFNQFKDTVEKVPIEELTFLWYDDFYDGILCGMLEYKSQKYRFEIVTDYKHQNRPRVFAIVQLSEEQVADETQWHNLFEKYVDNNTAFSSNDTTHNEQQIEQNLFYKNYRRRLEPNYNLCSVKAWYVEE